MENICYLSREEIKNLIESKSLRKNENGKMILDGKEIRLKKRRVILSSIGNKKNNAPSENINTNASFSENDAISLERVKDFSSTITNYFVYILECRGFYKVGISKDIRERVQTLQIGNPFKINCSSFLRTTSKENALYIEQEIHSYLKKNKMHMRGEWFKGIDKKIYSLYDFE